MRTLHEHEIDEVAGGLGIGGLAIAGTGVIDPAAMTVQAGLLVAPHLSSGFAFGDLGATLGGTTAGVTHVSTLDGGSGVE